MDQEVKKKWVEALRSGQYKQGKRRLRMSGYGGGPDLYCCLGVLCNVVNSDGWGPSGFSWSHATTKLPVYLLERIQLAPEEQDRLIAMNDHFANTFEHIANWIEEKL